MEMRERPDCSLRIVSPGPGNGQHLPSSSCYSVAGDLVETIPRSEDLFISLFRTHTFNIDNKGQIMVGGGTFF